MTDVAVANDMIPSEGRALEFAGAYFRDIVRELGAHGILDFDFLNQEQPPLSDERQGSQAVSIVLTLNGEGLPRTRDRSLFSLWSPPELVGAAWGAIHGSHRQRRGPNSFQAM